MRKNNLLLAFGSNARVGKDTAVDYISKMYDGDVVRVSFAKPLYDLLHLVQDSCGMEREKDRDFLQFIGTWVKKKDQNFWVNLAKQNITEQFQKGKNIVLVSDVRYPNEFEMLRELGFTLIKIERKVETDLTLEQTCHSSENSLSNADWDFTIDNNGTLEDFYRKIDKFIKQ
jgi:hypothetical protein